MHATVKAPELYGLLAEFSSSERLVEAAKMAREAGYSRVEAYSPFSIEGLADEIGTRDDRVPWIVFGCGVTGALLGFALQLYVSAIDYPMNVGGRPDISWPTFIPITFECGILLASFGGLGGMLALNGLPKPYNPLFGCKKFDRCSTDKFFLCIEATDPNFDQSATAAFLNSTNPDSVTEVMP